MDPICVQVIFAQVFNYLPFTLTFVFRFNIEDISEFYGSTEGNSNILNFDNTVGAVGFVPVLFSSILPLGPIKVLKRILLKNETSLR